MTEIEEREVIEILLDAIKNVLNGDYGIVVQDLKKAIILLAVD